MSCEKYRKAITEALASGGQLPPNVRSHVHGCPLCRAALAQEEALLAAIDKGVRDAVHCEVPGSFQAVVRARMQEEAVPKPNGMRTWAVLAASAALILGIVLVRNARHAPVSQPKEPTFASTNSPQAKTPRPQRATTLPRATASPRAPGQRTRRQDQSSSGVFVAEVRPFVPANQRQAVDQLIAGVQRGELKEEILLRENWNGQIEDLQISPIEVPSLPATSVDEGSVN